MDRAAQVTELEWQLLVERIRVDRALAGDDIDADLTPDELTTILKYYQDKIRNLENEIAQPPSTLTTGE